MKPSAFVASVLFVALAPCQSETPRPADKATPPKAPFVFEPGVVELKTLIERCGAYLQRNILVDDSELMTNTGRRGKPPAAVGPAAAQGAGAPQAADGPTGPFVELQLPVVTDRNGCEEMLASLLWTRGLALVPLDEAKGVYEVLAMNGQRAREIALRAVQRTTEQVLARPALRQFVTVVLELRNTNSQYATNSLRPFFSTNGNSPVLNLGNVGNSTSLILSGPQDVVAGALQLLKASDVPQPPDARPELTQRLDALAQQNAQLAQRVAALEEKLKQKN
jgi:hypothetical protein